jgi:hypothetical protein
MNMNAEKELLELRKQFIFDIFITALEGGIDYWAVVEEYHHSKEDKEDLEGFFAKVSDCEGEEAFPDNSIIDKDIIVKGINKIINDKDLKIPEETRKRIKEADRLNDAGLIDADDADCIVQVGLMGEIVFG